jgi:hypothetical protein
MGTFSTAANEGEEQRCSRCVLLGRPGTGIAFESTALITKESGRYLDECASEVPLNGRRSMSHVIRHEAHRESALARQHRKQRQMEQHGCPLPMQRGALPDKEHQSPRVDDGALRRQAGATQQ